MSRLRHLARGRPEVRRRRVMFGVAIATVALATASAGSSSVAGSAGTDTSLPPTDSQVTVSGRGPFGDLRITVNQTRDLVNQAVSVDWEGATPTRQGPGRFGANYLQVMQCWGEDDGTNPSNPGPPPEQCFFGAKAPVSGSGLFPQFTFSYERIISQRNWPNFDPAVGFLEERTGYVWRPFRAADGVVVNSHYNPDFRPDIEGGNFWLNPKFDVVTSNEIQAARTGPNGKGSELFEVLTGLEASGLGCGRQIEPTADGGTRIPRCWLVVVPRGLPSVENAGTPYESDADAHGVVPSALAPAQWQHRIAVPLEFRPVQTACALGSDEVRIGGSEMAAPAVFNWQPKLCERGGSRPYVFTTISDGSARQQLVQNTPGAPGMVVSSRPIDEGGRDPSSPVVYAPLTLSGTVIAFTVERNPKLSAPDEAQALAGVRVAQLNLTPRLLAKLLTQSYTAQVNIGNSDPYDWTDGNPVHMGVDPDFLQFNKEFEQLDVVFGKNFGGFVMPVSNSDAALQVWHYVLADPEARAWLDGLPDPWGMRVNPVYATHGAVNPAGIGFGDPPPVSFPKSDPYCYQAPPMFNSSIVPPPLCATDWLPYTESMREAARLTRAADDRARATENPFAFSADQAWKRDLPQTIGSRSILSITDSASASQFGLQTARLSRAGDDRPDRTFVGPDAAGLTAGVSAMKPGSEQAVLEPDALAAVDGAYPLALLTYAAVKPLALDTRAREEYAAFVDYASGDGQAPGRLQGQLPLGYAPLPGSLQTQAKQAAVTIRTLQPPAPEPEPTAPAGETALPTGPSQLSEFLSPVDSVDFSLTDLPSVSSPRPAALLDAGTTLDEGRGATTPVFAVGRARYAVPILSALALLAALGALEITKRPRRTTTGGGEGTGEQAPGGPRAPVGAEGLA